MVMVSSLGPQLVVHGTHLYQPYKPCFFPTASAVEGIKSVPLNASWSLVNLYLDFQESPWMSIGAHSSELNKDMLQLIILLHNLSTYAGIP